MLFAFFLTFLVGLGGVTWAPPAFWGDVLMHTPSLSHCVGWR